VREGVSAQVYVESMGCVPYVVVESCRVQTGLFERTCVYIGIQLPSISSNSSSWKRIICSMLIQT